MSSREAFLVAGVIPRVTEKPCFCTPLFRDADGSFYAQSSSNGQTIEEFVYLGDFPSHPIVKLRLNREFRVGDELLCGFRLHTRQHVIDARADMYGMILRDFHEYTDDRELIIFILERVLDDERIYEVFSSIESAYMLNVLSDLMPTKGEDKYKNNLENIEIGGNDIMDIDIMKSSVNWRRYLKELERKSVELINYSRGWMFGSRYAERVGITKAALNDVLIVLKAGR